MAGGCWVGSSDARVAGDGEVVGEAAVVQVVPGVVAVAVLVHCQRGTSSSIKDEVSSLL